MPIYIHSQIFRHALLLTKPSLEYQKLLLVQCLSMLDFMYLTLIKAFRNAQRICLPASMKSKCS